MITSFISSDFQLMAANEYRNKKISVVIPNDIYPILEQVAVVEERSVSMMAMRLIREALESRGLVEPLLPLPPRTTD